VNSRQAIAGIALLLLLLGASGCKFPGRKKPKLPPQAQAPTISIPSNTSDTTPGPTPPMGVEPARPLPTPGEVEVATANPPKLPPPPKNHRRVVPPPPPPKKTVVQNDPTPAQPAQGPLTASISHDDALRQRMDTTQLLEATETNLRGLNRSLSNDEQATVQHVRAYVNQSQKATSDGDLERAYNLALKAHLLSDELAKKK
jgi:outer membrane biosynthesis protein TonB